MEVGHIAGLWRYPVKSMGGEKVGTARFDQYGMIGDRAWAAINTETGDIGWAKAYPRLLDLQARYTQEPPVKRVYGGDVPQVTIEFPPGEEPAGGDHIDSALSAFAGAPLQLSPLQPPDDRQHYRWQTPVDYDAILKILGIGPDESPPDLSAYDESLIELLAEYFAPPGTYNDMFPVHALTTSSIAHMERHSGEAFVVERFRPNFLIQTAEGIEGPVEFDWVGKTLRIGECRFQVAAKTIRCSMPSRGQRPQDLPQNPNIAKSLFAATGRFLGAYLSVIETGEIQVGDSVTLA